MLSKKVVAKLAGHETPFYLYDMDLLRSTLESLRTEASKYGYIVHFAIKANFDPRIISPIKNYGIGIDCASGNEVRCAIEAGFEPSRIVTKTHGGDPLSEDFRRSLKAEGLHMSSEEMKSLYRLKGTSSSYTDDIDGIKDAIARFCLDGGRVLYRFKAE